MIIDSPGILQLAVGTDKRIPEIGDNQIQVPPMILPVVTPTQTMRFAQSASELQNTSFFILTSDSRTNQAANVTTMCTVGKGLWDFLWAFTVRSNYISASLVNGADITWNNSIFAGGLFSRLPVGTAAVPQSTLDIIPMRMLLGEQCTFELRVGITGAGQTIEALVRLIANKII